VYCSSRGVAVSVYSAPKPSSVTARRRILYSTPFSRPVIVNDNGPGSPISSHSLSSTRYCYDVISEPLLLASSNATSI